MKDSIAFPLVLATVFAGALLAVFDPANRRPASVAEVRQAEHPTSTVQPATATTTHRLPS